MFQWLRDLIIGPPHFVIWRSDIPYLMRWHLIPQNRFFNAYLHKFVADDDEVPHDHPWKFVSIILKGSYIEHLDGGLKGFRGRFSIGFRRADHRHRVELPIDDEGNKIPCWTIILTGPKCRDWGFWCPQGFVPWRRFVSRRDSGKVGNGCG